MVYSDMVNKACRIMFDAHKDDLDKGGYPYVFHPFYLATQMDDENSTVKRASLATRTIAQILIYQGFGRLFLLITRSFSFQISFL